VVVPVKADEGRRSRKTLSRAELNFAQHEIEVTIVLSFEKQHHGSFDKQHHGDTEAVKKPGEGLN
jgi:hypothetical protein